MEKKKINFSNIKGMLSNDQMKSIKGGSAGTPGCGTKCTIILSNGGMETGICGTYGTATNYQCACYSPTPGYMQFGNNGCSPQ